VTKDDTMSADDDERITRPEPDRTDPIRAWRSLLGAATDGGARGGELNDVVARSVDLGYRIVDEYIRQGQKAAQRVSTRSYAPETATGDFQEMSSRLAQYSSDFLRLWMEFVDVSVRGNASRAAPTPNGDPVTPQGGASEAAAPAPGVRVEIVASRPTNVSVDLRPQAHRARLTARPLHAVDPDKPPLTSVTLFRDAPDGALTVRVEVPDEHPAGVYHGVVLDEDANAPVGTLSVRIADRA
jgi:hypothetical protein